MTEQEHRAAHRAPWRDAVADQAARDERRHRAVEAVASVALAFAVVLGVALVYASGLARP